LYKPPLVGSVRVVELEAGGLAVVVAGGSAAVVALSVVGSLDVAIIFPAVVMVGTDVGSDVA
jgi:hypothetical protein